MQEQLKYIDYVKNFSNKEQVVVYSAGFFLTKTFTKYSDVDLYVVTKNPEIVRKLIYGYSSKPIYISKTLRPYGIIIIIYENGVAVDLSVIELKNNMQLREEYYFLEHKIIDAYETNNSIYKYFVLSSEKEYGEIRLFHRSLIKFLSGNKAKGIEILNELAAANNIEAVHDFKQYNNHFDKVYNIYLNKGSIPLLMDKTIKKLRRECEDITSV